MTQEPELAVERGVCRGQHPAVAGGQQLAGMKREAGNEAVRPPDPLPLPVPLDFATHGAGGVLDDRYPVPAGHIEDGAKVARHTELVHDEHSPGARADRLLDMCDVVGVRENQLIGYGVVVGLQGTGDDVSAPFAMQSLRSLLRRLGVQIDQSQLRLRNVAAVLVTANIPAFIRSGARIDVTVATLDHPERVRANRHIWTSSRLPWLHLDEDLPGEAQESL